MLFTNLQDGKGGDLSGAISNLSQGVITNGKSTL